MPQLPPLPPKHTLPIALWTVLDKIITFLKALTIRGDNKTIRVNQTDGGITISAILPPGKVYIEKTIYFLEVSTVDGDGCPNGMEWHKYTILLITDEVVAEMPT